VQTASLLTTFVLLLSYYTQSQMQRLFHTALFVLAQSLLIQNADAADKFYCGVYQSVPATLKYISSTGKTAPIILWKSSHFTESGYSPQRRCEEVSIRFNNLFLAGRLKFLTTGRINQMPVICASVDKDSGCRGDDILYTLKPGQNASQTLRNLLTVRTRVSGPLTETTERPYISIEEIVDANSSTSNQGNSRPLKVEPSSPTTNIIKQNPADSALW